MIQMFPNQAEDTIAFKVMDKITKADYEILSPIIENKIKKSGKVNVFCQIENITGIEPEALWKDVKFDLEHLNDFKNIVIVGDKKWQDWVAGFAKPFTKAEIKYFDKEEASIAFEWLMGRTASPSDNLN